MKADIEIAPVLAACRHAAIDIEGSPRIPILGAVRWTIDGSLVVSRCGDETMASATVDAIHADSRAEFAVDAGMIVQCLRSTRGDTATIEHNGRSLVIRSKSSRMSVGTMPTDGMPDLGDADEAESAPVASNFLAAACRACQPVAAKVFAPNKYGSTGMLVSAKGGRLAVVALEANRMMMTAGPWSGPDAEIVAPMRSIAAAIAMSDLGDEVSMSIGERSIQWSVGGMSHRALGVAHDFPAYELVVPKETMPICRVDAADLLAGAKAVSHIEDKGDERNTAATLRMSGGTLVIEASSVFGEASVEIPCTDACDEDWSGCFRHNYLRDAASIGGELTILVGRDRQKLLVVRNDITTAILARIQK